MKISKLLLLVVAAVCAYGDTYDKYQDWQFRPVTVHDTNAVDNVRNQIDFTKPMHGPWLMNPSYTSISINSITRLNCAAGIEYREKGTEAYKRIWQASYGLPAFLSDTHLFHLTGLKPATEYEYRLVNALSTYDSPYTGTVVGRETYSFKTLDPNISSYSVFVTSDVHGAFRHPLYVDIFTGL